MLLHFFHRIAGKINFLMLDLKQIQVFHFYDDYKLNYFLINVAYLYILLKLVISINGFVDDNTRVNVVTATIPYH